MSAAAPAGWYADGVTPGQERYWDGAQWTDRFRPIAPAFAPPPPRPGGALVSFKQILRGAGLMARGYAENAIDEARSLPQRGGVPLLAWLVPVAVNAILVGFWFIAFVASPVGLLREALTSALGGLGGLFGGLGGSVGGSLGGSLGGLINTSAMAGVLAGAFFVGLALGAAFFAARACALVLTARVRGGRIGFADALVIVATAHSLSPVGLVLATAFLAIPGTTGLILFLIVTAVIGLPLLLLSEHAVAIGAGRATSFARPPVFANALYGGLAIAVVVLLAGLVGWGLMTAAMNAVAGGVGNGLLGGIGSLLG